MGGAAFFAVGEGSGEDRARKAAENAITNHLLDVTLQGARGILLNITSSPSITMQEVGHIAELIREIAHPDVNLLFGTAINPELGDVIRVTVIATGFDQTDMRSSSIRRVFHRPEDMEKSERNGTGSDSEINQRNIMEKFSSTYYDKENMEIPAYLRNRENK
jgi:cell division protein FtsZ